MQAGQGTALLTCDLQREQELPRLAATASASASTAHSIFHAKRGCCAATTCCTDPHTHTHTQLFTFMVHNVPGVRLQPLNG